MNQDALDQLRRGWSLITNIVQHNAALDSYDKQCLDKCLRAVEAEADRLKLGLSDADHQAYVEAWFAFIQQLNGFRPTFKGREAKLLKEIRQELTKKARTVDEALITWQAICTPDRWNRLNEFHRNTPTIPHIHKYLDEILTKIKNETTSKEAQRAASDQSRERLADEIRKRKG